MNYLEQALIHLDCGTYYTPEIVLIDTNLIIGNPPII